jgi:hypothetical protein
MNIKAFSDAISFFSAGASIPFADNSGEPYFTLTSLPGWCNTLQKEIRFAKGGFLRYQDGFFLCFGLF